MDFLDPKKQRAHDIRLIIGYILIGLAILLATLILLYQAYGFGLGKNGQVVQNGFVFMSSQPGGADIYVNDKLAKNTTNTRLQLPEGTYRVALKKTGYLPWNRTVDVDGGLVYRYDYPLLVPQSLNTTTVSSYQTKPGFATQSPDRRWILTQRPGSMTGFDVYDTSDPKQVNANTTQITVPSTVLSSTSGTWQLTEWSNDNRHVILEHDYSGGSEYILVDRTDPTKSENLTKAFGLVAGQVLSLVDKKYDRYYIFTPDSKTVDATSLSDPTTLTPELTDVLAFKSYSDNMFLYATDKDAPDGMVVTYLKDGSNTYKIREVAASNTILLNLAQYSGDWYVAVGSAAENKVYVFKNPEAARQANKSKNLVPLQIMRVTNPNYLEFSASTRFIMVESGTQFAVYDAEYDMSYTYSATEPLGGTVKHATWMDGDRIMYVSNNKVFFFDYDNTNAHLIVPADVSFLPFFDTNYHYLYTLTPPAPSTGGDQLTETSLLTPKDQ